MNSTKVGSLVVQELENGLKILASPIKGSRSVTITIGYQAGGFYEEGFGSGSNDGISHFLEHMIFKGTPTRTTSQFNEEFTKMGADINAMTTTDKTIYFSKLPNRNLSKAIEIWADALRTPAFKPNEFEAEKQVLLQEIKMRREDMPSSSVMLKVRSLLFKGTSLEHDVTGTVESVRDINLEMMKEYFTTYYSPDNCIIALTGNINWENAEDVIANTFGEIPLNTASVSKRKNPWKDINENWTGVHEFSIQPSAHPVSFVALAWELPGVSTKHAYAAFLLDTLIGNSRTSTLYKEIISKGVNSTGKYYQEMYSPVSVGILSFSSTPERVPVVLNQIHEKVFRKVANMTITTEHTQQLIDEVKGRYILDTEDPMVLALDLIDKSSKFGFPTTPETVISNLEQVSREELDAVRNEVFDDFQFSVYATGTLPKEWKPKLSITG